MTLSDDQLALRRMGMGGSDIGAILRRNPWKGPTDVWLEKTGQAPAFESTQRSRNGHRFEPVARAWYAEEARPGAVIRQPGTIEHPTLDWWLATPDGIVWNDELAVMAGTQPDRGLEIKTHTIHLRHLYGEPGTDQIPPWELLQCAWYMGCTGLPEWDLVALIDGEFSLYTVARDLELEALMAEAAEDFLVRYVKTGEPPPPDASEGYARELLRRFPRHTSAELVEADGALRADVLELRDIRRDIARLEEREGHLVATIKAAIGDKAGVAFAEDETDDRGRIKTGKITWKRAADSRRTDWKAYADELQHQATLRAAGASAMIERALAAGALNGWQATGLVLGGVTEAPSVTTEQYTTTIPGSRRFCVPRGWGKTDE